MTESSNKPHACKQVCSSLNRDVVIYSLVLIQVHVVLCCCFCFHFAVYVLGVCLVASPFLYQYLAVLKKYNIRDFWVCSNCITWFLNVFLLLFYFHNFNDWMWDVIPLSWASFFRKRSIFLNSMCSTNRYCEENIFLMLLLLLPQALRLLTVTVLMLLLFTCMLNCPHVLNATEALFFPLSNFFAHECVCKFCRPCNNI
jgi:hypothetical protein